MRTIKKQWGPENLDLEPIVLTGRDAESLNTYYGNGGPEIAVVTAWLCEDVSFGKEPKTVLYIDSGASLVCTISDTFINDFVGLFEWADSKNLRFETVIIEQGRSNKGRVFYRCTPGKRGNA